MVAMRRAPSGAPGPSTGLPTRVWPPPSFGSEANGSFISTRSFIYVQTNTQPAGNRRRFPVRIPQLQKKLNEAADRALDYYLKPDIPKDTKRKPSTIYHVGAEVDNETLLVNACESLASASMMLSEFAGLMDMPHRNMMLGIQSVVMLGELAVNRVLDNLDPRG